MRKTKIIATVGPACQDEKILKALILEGVDVFRINASHSTPDQMKTWFDRIRKVSRALKEHTAILVDLQGPRVRTGKLTHGPLMLVTGATVVLHVDSNPAPRMELSTTCREFTRMVKTGDAVLIDNGAVELEVLSVGRSQVQAKVIRGGAVGDNKGINLPLAPITLPALTAKDLKDLKAASQLGADYIALSFVRSHEDVLAVKKWMKKNSVQIPIIAKIEKPRAVNNIQSILAISDGLMVARGDLGIEMGIERVPRLQKMLIHEALGFQLPVITATQMLETMINSSHPTRAEVSDVANAVFDGTDAVMLSGETSIGRYPVEVVRTMRKIVEEAEGNGKEATEILKKESKEQATFTSLMAIAHAALGAAREAKAKAIVIFTQTGRIARILSKLKPPCALLPVTESMSTLSRLNLLRGVTPIHVKKSLDSRQMLHRTDEEMLRSGIVKKGDTVILIFGPWALPGSFSMMAIHRAGDARS